MTHPMFNKADCANWFLDAFKIGLEYKGHLAFMRSTFTFFIKNAKVNEIHKVNRFEKVSEQSCVCPTQS